MLALAVMGGVLSYGGGLVLVEDDFSTTSIHIDNRFNLWDIDRNWWVRRNAAWSISGEQLTNPALVATDEEVTHRMDSVTSTDASRTKITVSFDYSVGAGTTLYYFAHLFTGTASSLSGRFTAQNGSFYQDFGGAFSGPEYRLQDGGAISGSPANALASFAGGTSGAFAQTFDISGFGGGGFCLTNVTYILNSFTSNHDTTGGVISIDNLHVATPPLGMVFVVK